MAIAWSLGGQHSNPAVHDGETANLWRFASGLSATFGDFTIGGAFRWTNDGLKGKNDNIMTGIGATYVSGAWSFSLAYAFTRDQDGLDGGTPDKMSLLDGGAVYNLGPGVDLFTGVQWARFSGDSGGPQSSGIKGYVGTKLTF